MSTNIPKYFISKVAERLGVKAEKICRDVLKRDLEDLIREITLQEYHLKDRHEVRRKTFRDTFQRTKKTWHSSLRKSVESSSTTNRRNELLKEIDLANEMLERYGVERFRSFYQVEDLDELIENRLKQVEEWKNDSDMKLIDYLYIFDKTKNQAFKALRADIILGVADTLIIDFNDRSLDGIIVEKPNYLVDNAVYSDGSSKVKVANEIVNINNEHYQSSANPYKPHDDYEIKMLFKKGMIDDDELALKCLKTLDDKDDQIYNTVMTHNNIELMRDRKVYIEIGKLVKEVYGSQNATNYMAVESRLVKMASIKFHVVQSNDVLIFGLFDLLRITELEGGGKLAEITINEVLHQQYIEKKVTRIYSDKINRFQIAKGKHLIFPLQNERIQRHLKSGTSPLLLSYNFFASKMHFRNRKKDVNMGLIEKSLQEFVDQGVTVKSFTRKGDYFQIEFLPFAPYELEDLLGNNQSSHDIIEAGKLLVD